MATEKQFEVLQAFYDAETDRMPAPTYRGLCQRFGWKSSGTARDHIRALVRQGLLERLDSLSTSVWRLTPLGVRAAKRKSTQK
jgi:DNA-binding MarR family transcriptional regulator